MKFHLGLLIGFLSSPSTAQKQTFGNDLFQVTIKPNFNTAEYFLDTPDGSYKLKFTRFFETVDGKVEGGSNTGLSSLDWTLENINETEEEVSFDIIGVDDAECGFDEIIFHNVLLNESVKFDLNITGYTFCSSDEDAMLNLQYTFTGGPGCGSEDDEDEEDVDDVDEADVPDARRLKRRLADDGEESCGNSLTLSNDTHVYVKGSGGYFAIVEEAYQNGETTPSVAVALSVSGNKVTTTYTGFTGGDLFHDPKTGAEEVNKPKKGCFSPDAMVTVQGKGKVPMKDIAVGDMVLTGSGQYSSVYTIDHHHATRPTKYIQIDTTIEGEQPLELTPSHMLFIQGESNPIPASTVKVGDAVRTLNGYEDVTGIKSVLRSGLYNPITTDGTIVVDGVVASAYSAILANDKNVVIGGWKTPISHQAFFDLSLAPLRVLCTSVSSSLCETDEEYNAYSKFGTHFLEFTLNQNIYVQRLLFAVVLLFFGLLSCSPLIVGLFCYNKCSGKKTITKC